MAGKQVVRIGTIAVGLILVWFFLAAPLWLDVDEGAVPPMDLALPAGASVAGVEKQCGSGGCWLEVSIDPGQGRSSFNTARVLGLSQTPRCALGGPPFFWTICRWSGGTGNSPGALVVSLQYQR